VFRPTHLVRDPLIASAPTPVNGGRFDQVLRVSSAPRQDFSKLRRAKKPLNRNLSEQNRKKNFLTKRDARIERIRREGTAVPVWSPSPLSCLRGHASLPRWRVIRSSTSAMLSVSTPRRFSQNLWIRSAMTRSP